MLPKSKRLTTKTVASVMGKGQSTHSPFFVARLVPTQEASRFSVSVPKKVAKTAVQRNKIRRQVFSALKEVQTETKSGFDGVVVVKVGIEKLPFTEIVSEIRKIFVKSSVLK